MQEPDQDSGVDWSLVADIGAAMFTAGTVLAALIAVRATERSATGTVVHARKLSTVEHISSRQQRYRDLVFEIGDLPAAPKPIPQAQWDQLLVLMGIWEHTAAGLTAGVFDIEVLNKMTGGNILTTYQRYARFLRQRRRENPRIYDQLEVLIDKLLVMQTSVFRVDRRALRRLRQLGVADSTLADIAKLKRQTTYEYNDLLRGLIGRNLEPEKTLVMTCTRQPAFDIEVATDRDHEQVVALFERVQRHSDGAYPPRNRTDHEGNVAAWLALGAVHGRYLVRRGGAVIAYVELEDLEQVRRDGTHDEQARTKRSAYWHRAFEAQPAFADDPTMELERLMVIKRLAVDPDHQRSGLGRILLRHAIQVIQFSHRRIPALVVLADLNPAVALYESEGATRIGTFSGHAGDDLYSYVF